MAHLTCAIITGVVLILGLICAVAGIKYASELDVMKAKIYDEQGDCRECGYPGRLRRQQDKATSELSARLSWNSHNANCPVGRLGL